MVGADDRRARAGRNPYWTALTGRTDLAGGATGQRGSTADSRTVSRGATSALSWLDAGGLRPRAHDRHRLAFAALTSLYLVVAIPWEERSLEATFGAAYAAYKQTVRWKVVPGIY